MNTKKTIYLPILLVGLAIGAIPCSVHASDEGSSKLSTIASCIKENKTKTIFITAVIWNIIDKYLTEKGNKLVDEPFISKSTTTLKERILHKLNEIIGYRIKKKRKVKMVTEMNGRKIEQDGDEIIETELESQGLGWLMDMIVKPFKGINLKEVQEFWNFLFPDQD